MRIVLTILMLLLVVPMGAVACDTAQTTTAPRDDPPPRRTSKPASNHERLQIDIETAIREIDIDIERITLESDETNSATARVRLDQLRSLRAWIEKLRDQMRAAATTESTEFQLFRREHERKLADRAADIRALEQMLKRESNKEEEAPLTGASL